MKLLVGSSSRKILGAALLGIEGDEVVHSLLQLMAADFAVRADDADGAIHPTVGEVIPTMLAGLKPLE